MYKILQDYPDFPSPELMLGCCSLQNHLTTTANSKFPYFFSKGEMNLRSCSSLMATLLTTLTTTFCTAIPSQASPSEALDPDSQATSALTKPITATNATPTAATSTLQSPEVKQPELLPSVALDKLASQDSITTIHVYQQGQQQAATLYIHSIPILTFLSTNPGNTSRQSFTALVVSTQPQQDPALRAARLANRLNQLLSSNFDANSLTANWDAQNNSYLIKVNGERLVAINQQTILPDTTGNLAEDTRQAANRLRRLLGNAPPLLEVAGIPDPVVSTPTVIAQAQTKQIAGMASWYGPGFHGRLSASGERFNQNAMTAAHRTLPFGTRVRVTNVNNGRSVVVRINDRGPFIRGRVIDLSAAAARQLGMINSGVAPVRIDILN